MSNRSSRLTLFIALGYVAATLLMYAALPQFPGQVDQVAWNYAAVIILVLLVRTTVKQRAMEVLAPRWAGRRLLVTTVLTLVLILVVGVAFMAMAKAATDAESRFLPLAALPSILQNNARILLAGGLIVTALEVGVVWIQMPTFWRALSMNVEDLKTTLIVIVVGTCLAALRNLVFLGQTHWSYDLSPVTMLAIPAFMLQLLVNGFPEEVLFRVYILGTLLRSTRKVYLALLGMIIVFDLFHVPLQLLTQPGGTSWWLWVVYALFPSQPTGLLYGYLYLRRRSLVPSVAVHTYFSLWGFPFVS